MKIWSFRRSDCLIQVSLSVHVYNVGTYVYSVFYCIASQQPMDYKVLLTLILLVAGLLEEVIAYYR